MKKFALVTAFTLAATTAFAGNVSEPIIEEEVIVQETTSSAGGILVPLIFLVFTAAVAAG